MGQGGFRHERVFPTRKGWKTGKTAGMGVLRHKCSAALALALFSLVVAECASGGVFPDDRFQPGSGLELRASAMLLTQAGRGVETVPSIFQGMMIQGLQRNRDCRSAEEIHDRLKRQGWWDFGDLERKGEHFTVRARRPNGSSYKLTIDGCSGRVLGAMRLNGGQRGYRLWPR